MRQRVEYGDHSDGNILCPRCGSGYTHQHEVAVFNRSEDAEEWVCTTVAWRLINQELNTEGNPSRRRQGLRISIECEECGEYSGLNIYQHKGQTFIEWEDAP